MRVPLIFQHLARMRLAIAGVAANITKAGADESVEKVARERTGCSPRIEQCVWYPERSGPHEKLDSERRFEAVWQRRWIALSVLDPAGTHARWKALFGSDPPDRLRRPLLIQALAYRLQEKALGGLKPATRRLLASVAGGAETRRPIAIACQAPSQSRRGADPGVARHQASGYRPERRIHVPREALSIALEDRR